MQKLINDPFYHSPNMVYLFFHKRFLHFSYPLFFKFLPEMCLIVGSSSMTWTNKIWQKMIRLVLQNFFFLSQNWHYPLQYTSFLYPYTIQYRFSTDWSCVESHFMEACSLPPSLSVSLHQPIENWFLLALLSPWRTKKSRTE